MGARAWGWALWVSVFYLHYVVDWPLTVYAIRQHNATELNPIAKIAIDLWGLFWGLFILQTAVLVSVMLGWVWFYNWAQYTPFSESWTLLVPLVLLLMIALVTALQTYQLLQTT